MDLNILDDWNSRQEDSLTPGGDKSGNGGTGGGWAGPQGTDRDRVDISSETAQMMRELAESESIQNFVTLTPTVQVTTGDIHEYADIDTMIREIEKTLEQELASSAERVYGP